MPKLTDAPKPIKTVTSKLRWLFVSGVAKTRFREAFNPVT